MRSRLLTKRAPRPNEPAVAAEVATAAPAKAPSVVSIASIVFGAFGVLVGVGGLWLANEQLVQARAEAGKARVDRVVERLYEQEGTSTELGEAFVTAISDRSVVGLTISCPDVIPEHFEGNVRYLAECPHPKWFTDVRLEGSDLVGEDLISRGIQDSRFEFAILKNWRVSGIHLINVDFISTHFQDVALRNTVMAVVQFADIPAFSADFRGSILERVSFAGSDVTDANFAETKFRQVDVSRTILCDFDGCLQGWSRERANETWYREGEPPYGMDLLPADQRPHRVCPSNTNVANVDLMCPEAPPAGQHVS